MLYQQKRKILSCDKLSSLHCTKSPTLPLAPCRTLMGWLEVWLLFGLKCFPLLGFALAMYKQHLRQLAWMCFVLLIYFTIEIMYVPINGILGAFIISLLFITTMLHIRWHNRANEELKAD